MTQSWQAQTLGDFVTLQRGHDLTEPERRIGYVPVVGSAGQNGFHDTALAKGPGVVIGRSGASFGQVHFCPTDYWPHNTGLYVTDFKGNDPRFAFYFLKALDFDRYNSGSAQPSLNRNFIYPISICVPEPAEQKAIATMLGTLDDKIELNRRMNATLEAMARALFQSWFVNFDPVYSKLDGRSPFGLDKATSALFPSTFHDSEGGKLPANWRYVPVSELCGINSWTLGKNSELDMLEYIEISEVNRGNIAHVETYQRGEEPSRARRHLRHGDTVLSTVRPDRGAYFLAWNPPPNRIASTGFAVVTPMKAPWSFIHAALTQPGVFDHLGLMADGGTYPAVRPEIIGAWQLALPNRREILDAFHHISAPLFEQCEVNRIQSRTLAALRDTLLPKLLSGELRTVSVKQDAPNIVPFPVQKSKEAAKKTTDEFVEAVVIAQLVRKLATPEHPLGRKRYNKFAYLAHRKADEDVTQHYLKKAAGPYSPWAKYGGPEKIAEKNGYVEQGKAGVFTGLVVGKKIEEIDRYLPNYPVCAAIDWIVDKFRYKKNDDLELLATVDFAALDLLRESKPLNRETIKQVIAANKEWAPKLDRAVFSDINVDRALAELATLFPATYQS